MPNKNLSEMSHQELADLGVPYIVNPDDLEALGIDPEPYLKSGSNSGSHWAGYMLDRKKDAALIERLEFSERTTPNNAVGAIDPRS